MLNIGNEVLVVSVNSNEKKKHLGGTYIVREIDGDFHSLSMAGEPLWWSADELHKIVPDASYEALERRIINLEKRLDTKGGGNNCE